VKKYFAKYLPVEGEIKEGDKIAFEGNMNDILTFGTEVIPPKKYSDKKVELFLCGRDIQVGDTIYADNNYPNGIIISEEIFQTYESIKYLTNPHFKVIGKITKDAIWVKDGDEFDVEELLIPYRQRSFCLQSPYYDDEIINTKITDKKLKIDKNNFYHDIKIKGPCGHFH
jgi:hypothetical protein